MLFKGAIFFWKYVNFKSYRKYFRNQTNKKWQTYTIVWLHSQSNHLFIQKHHISFTLCLRFSLSLGPPCAKIEARLIPSFIYIMGTETYERTHYSTIQRIRCDANITQWDISKSKYLFMYIHLRIIHFRTIQYKCPLA